MTVEAERDLLGQHWAALEYGAQLSTVPVDGGQCQTCRQNVRHLNSCSEIEDIELYRQEVKERELERLHKRFEKTFKKIESAIGVDLWACRKCGSPTVSRRLHLEFHDKLQSDIIRAQDSGCRGHY